MEDPIKKAVKILNEAIEADESAIRNLFNKKVLCNEQLADHPSIQVSCKRLDASGTGAIVCRVGTLGLINGLFGIDEGGYGFIEAEVESQPDPDFPPHNIITKIKKFYDKREFEGDK